LRASKMNGFILGFQRFVWCPKWTPDSNNSFTPMLNIFPLVKNPPERTIPRNTGLILMLLWPSHPHEREIFKAVFPLQVDTSWSCEGLEKVAKLSAVTIFISRFYAWAKFLRAVYYSTKGFGLSCPTAPSAGINPPRIQNESGFDGGGCAAITGGHIHSNQRRQT
jgi:hypothetical protein